MSRRFSRLFNYRGLCAGGNRREHIVLGIDQRRGIVAGNLESMPVRDGIRGTGFDAITTENTAAVVNVINLRVALPAADAHFIGIFGSFDIYAVGGAGGRAKEACDALLHAVF